VLILGTLLGVDWLFIYMCLAGGWNNLWWTGGLLAAFLATTVYFAKPAFHAMAEKTLTIDETGVRWLISGRLQWKLAWDEIASAHSIHQHVPDDIAVQGFGLKSKSGSEYNIGDLMDMGPTGELEDAFNVIGEELVRRGTPVEDEAGWAGATILADKVDRGELCPDPKIEGRWQKTGYDVRAIVGVLVLGFVLMLPVMSAGPHAPSAFENIRFIAISSFFLLTVMGSTYCLLTFRNISGILFDERKVTLRVGLFRRRKLPLDWSQIRYFKAGPYGEPSFIHLRSGKVYRAFLPQKTIEAFKARLGANSKHALQGHREFEPVDH
jgi:hypothetical protein